MLCGSWKQGGTIKFSTCLRVAVPASQAGNRERERAPGASGTCSSGHLGLAGPGQEQWDWRELKGAKACFAGTIPFGGAGSSYNPEEAKRDLEHIREGATERLYMGEHSSRRAMEKPKLTN